MPTTPRHLPDHLRPDLAVLFVGINPGLRSAALGHHYAGHSNRFWKLLTESGLVPCPLTYRDDWRLPTWGLGLTNLVARPTAGSDGLDQKELALGRRRLLHKIRRYKPRVVAVLGIGMAPLILASSGQPMRADPNVAAPIKPIRIGWQPQRLEGARIFVLPNPSGRNAHYPYSTMLAGFRRLRRAALHLG